MAGELLDGGTKHGNSEARTRRGTGGRWERPTSSRGPSGLLLLFMMVMIEQPGLRRKKKGRQLQPCTASPICASVSLPRTRAGCRRKAMPAADPARVSGLRAAAPQVWASYRESPVCTAAVSRSAVSGSSGSSRSLPGRPMTAAGRHSCREKSVAALVVSARATLAR